MKWIGQQIYDFISRFRNDVYLENISTGTIASGGNLGLDANNKIVKADTEAGELAFSGSTANGVLTYGGAAQIDVESTLTYQGTSDGNHLLQSPVITGGNSVFNAYVLDVNAAYAGSHTVQGFNIDYDKSTVTTGSGNVNIKGLTVDLNDATTNEAGTFHNYFGIQNVLTHANAQGTITQYGIENTLVGGDVQYGIKNSLNNATAGTTYGLHQTIIDGGYDLYFRSSANTNDYFALQTGANGATTLTTVDNGGGTSADFSVVVDGTINLEGPKDFNFTCGDTDFLSIKNVASGKPFARFFSEDGNNSLLEIFELGGEVTGGGTVAGASFSISVSEHADTVIGTTDDGGENGDIRLDPDGDLKFTPETGDVIIQHGATSPTAGKPRLQIEAVNTTKTNSGELRFLKNANNVEDGEYLGKISFDGDNDAGTPEVITYAQIIGEINDMTDGSEEGKLEFKVASHDGELQPGLSMVSGNAEDEVDVTISNGATSLTTIAGDLTVTSQASIPQRLFAIPSDGAGNVDGDIVYIGTGSTVAGKIYYYKSDGSWGLTNSDDPSTATGWLAVALGTDPDADGMLVRGMVDLAGNIVGTEALGSIIYLDKATTGDATTAAPTATGDIVRIIGYAVSTGDTNKIWFSPDNTWVEHV